MPKPKNKYELAHQRRLAMYQRQVESVYDDAVLEAAAIGSSVGELAAGEVFTFAKHPLLGGRVTKLLETLQSRVMLCIVNGIQSEWTLANNKNDELARMVYGDALGDLTLAEQRRYFSNNSSALDAFLKRKEQGLTLSDRVWKYTNEFKGEIEMGLDLGIRKGQAAVDMARDLKSYLQHPDVLFRRVRDEHGNLHLSEAAKQFHPGQGVYRSSFKNARRLAATETNMAYRTADYLRIQEQDFVVGIKIQLSNNHTCLGRDGKPHEFYDICDELQGNYPKDFQFTGWHPHCRCFVTTILKTDAEIDADREAILNGEEPLAPEDSENYVSDVPQNFKDWLEDNKERSQTRFSVPQFMRDNTGKYVPEKYINMYASKNPYDTFAGYEKAMRYNKTHANFSDAQKKNIQELNKLLPVVQGRIMNISEADGKKVNPKYNAALEAHSFNCATAVPTYLLRRWGFDVEAGEFVRGKGKVYNLYNNVLDIWQRPDGSKIGIQDNEIKMWSAWAVGKPLNADVGLKSFIQGNTPEPGIYEVRLGWKKGGGHVTIVEKDNKGNIFYYNPQDGNTNWMKKWEHSCELNMCWLLRIDDKLIDPSYASIFVKTKKS